MAGARPRRTARPVDEFGFIELIRRRFGAAPPSVLTGIGDDAAVVSAPARGRWVFTTDLLAEGVHFSLETTSLEDLGHKAGAANLSDIAAMGATPQYLLVDLAVPPTLDTPALLGFYRGLSKLCRRYGVAVIGGDMSGSRDGLFIAITAIGTTAGAPAVLRQGAKPGDCLFVSGTIGDSLAGLQLMEKHRRLGRDGGALPTAARRTLQARHRRPTPRVELGAALGSRRLATAMIDLSDGLSGDLPHLCERSRVGAIVDARRLPLSAALRRFAQTTRQSPIELALQGGEDYELLFTVSPKHRPAVRRLAHRLRIPLTEIGWITEVRSGRRLLLSAGEIRPLPVTGYRHFHRIRRR